MAETANHEPESNLLAPGSRVEVRTGLDRSWAPGFEIDSTAEDGYRIRRRTDGQVLPATFAADTVRKERRDQMWWY